MPTEIKQIEDIETGNVILRIEGEMLRDDADLLEKIVDGLLASGHRQVVIDLADLDLLDSEAASVLRRINDRSGASIEGIEIFLQTAVDAVERGAH